MSGTKKYELVAPDGGWGYLIWIAVIIVYVTSTAFIPCFGILYDDLMTELGMASTSFTLLNGICGMSAALAGYSTGPMLKLINMRQLSLLGSILVLGGNIGVLFCKAQVIFFLSQAILCAGVGYLYNAATTILNDYFLVRRLFSIGLTQSVTAVVTITTPMFITWCIGEYGFRGTQLIVTGVSLHNLIAVCLMQPVKWHMKRVPILVEESEEINPLLFKGLDNTDRENAIKLSTKPNKESDLTSKKHSLQETNIVKEVVAEQKLSIGQRIVDVLGFALFKNIVFVSACVGSSLAMFADYTYAMILPQALYFDGWTENAVALLLTIYMIGDLVARLGTMVFSSFLMRLGYRMTYMIGLAISVVARLGMLLFKDQTTITVFSSILGISRCTINTLFPLVLCECVDQSEFSAAMGLVMLVFGIISLSIGPVIGMIRDLSGSYAASFYILTSFLAIIIMFWSIEGCVMRNKKKEQKQLEQSKVIKSKC